MEMGTIRRWRLFLLIDFVFGDAAYFKLDTFLAEKPSDEGFFHVLGGWIYLPSMDVSPETVVAVILRPDVGSLIMLFFCSPETE